ncbi:MAG: toprim domain-containing protein [Candidatus Dojkabacteria bacterium]|nr:toprim domain-containing protein [Candidatus Dojkabacteria bacterium]
MNNIKKLSDYEHVRLRTEMYFGSRNIHTQEILIYENEKPTIKEISWIPALYTYFREIFDNAVDEIIGHKFGNKIEIKFKSDTFEFLVEDNGRGIPIDYDEIEKCYVPELVLSHARAGRNFDEREEVVGTNGIGAAATNFTSEYFNVTVHRDKKIYKQCFKEGNEVFNELIVEKPKIKNVNSEKTGTKIEFKPSKKVFKDLILPEEFVRSRIFDAAISNPNMLIVYNGEKIKIKENFEKNLFENYLYTIITIDGENFYSKFVLVVDFVNSGEFYHTIVNGIPAFNGGVHIENFKKYFYSGLLNSLEKESKRRKLIPNRSDVTEGLLIFNITKMKSPNFDSQSKTRLINEEVGSIIKNFFTEKFFNEFTRKNKEWVEKIYTKCAERTKQKDLEEIAKASRKIAKKKIPKLVDANSNNRKNCVLFLAEGDSAISGLTAVRDPKIHAGMPLRGKIMNVRGENPKRILDNKELSEIMTAIGLKIGEKANREKLRYGKIYIATDADPDGGNIACLLINFFHSFWPELFDKNSDPYIYIFLTPFIIAEKNKERKYWYSYNYEDFKSEDYKNWVITRAKGLGSLTREDWKHSLEKPEIISIVDEGNLNQVLDLIFNENRTDDRKKWIANKLQQNF